jgi:hypothetical protein
VETTQQKGERRKNDRDTRNFLFFIFVCMLMEGFLCTAPCNQAGPDTTTYLLGRFGRSDMVKTRALVQEKKGI